MVCTVTLEPYPTNTFAFGHAKVVWVVPNTTQVEVVVGAARGGVNVTCAVVPEGPKLVPVKVSVHALTGPDVSVGPVAGAMDARLGAV